MKKLYLYPFWLRIWHWTNATLYILLILTGISMHYSDPSDPFLPFKTARLIHNTSGVLLLFMYLDYLISNFFTWNGKHYIPQFKGMPKRLFLQTRYYLYGIFKGEPHPFHPDEKSKFNPLQQITYISIMYVFMPLLIVTGVFLLFPYLLPETVFGVGGIWPAALTHLIVAYFLTLFTIGHIYLGTTGSTLTSNYKSMITGYHIHSEIIDLDKKETIHEESTDQPA